MRTLLLLLVLAAAGAAAWLTLKDPAPGAGATDVVPGRTAEEAREGPTLVGRAAPSARSVPRGDLAVRGQALLGNGKPATGALVVATLERVGEVARCRVGADGAYALTGLTKALHHLDARLVDGEREYGAEGWVSSGGDPYDLTLTLRPRTLEIRVLDPQGEPLPRFQARLVGPGLRHHLGVRGEGRVRVKLGVVMTTDGVLDVRGAFVEVWGARDLADRGLPYAPKRVGPLTGDEREVEVRLQPGSVIAGRVLGPDGPVGEAIKVSLSLPKARGEGLEAVVEEALEAALPGALEGPPKTQAPSPPFEGLSTEVKTDLEGAFQLAGLGVDAEHLVQVEAPPRFLPVAPVQARPGDPPLEVRLRATVTARITVLGPDGKPRPGASVHARPEGPRPGLPASLFSPGDSGSANAQADPAGVATLERLDPGATYTLHVEPEDESVAWRRRLPEATRRRLGANLPPEPEAGAPPAAKQNLRGWKPADTTVRLGPAYRVEGQVRDDANQLVAHAQVTLWREGDVDTTITDEDGRFTFEGLSPGRLRLRAKSGRGQGVFDWNLFVGGPEPAAPDEQTTARSVTLDLSGDVTGVLLRVPSTLTVTVRIAATPASTTPPKPADLLRGLFRSMQLTLLRKTDRGWERAGTQMLDPTTALSGKEQRVPVAGLEAGGRYGAWMPPVEGRYLWVEFAAEAGTVDAERREGGVVSGRVLDLPQGSAFARVSLRDELGREVSGVKTDREGRFEVHGLPPAQWTVRASHDAPGGRRLRAEGRAATGGGVDLRLAPAPEPKDGASPDPDDVRDEALDGLTR